LAIVCFLGGFPLLRLSLAREPRSFCAARPQGRRDIFCCSQMIAYRSLFLCSADPKSTLAWARLLAAPRPEAVWTPGFAARAGLPPPSPS